MVPPVPPFPPSLDRAGPAPFAGDFPRGPGPAARSARTRARRWREATAANRSAAGAGTDQWGRPGGGP